VFVYIPPCGELRGGAWVVVDPTINAEMMEMYAETNSRGGILEPPGICDVKFRRPDLLKLMQRNDPVLAELSGKMGSLSDQADIEAVQAQIDARQEQLLPLYLQVAYEFADLHDRPERMLAKGVIRKVVPWKDARRHFYWRLKRRLAEMPLQRRAEARAPVLSAREVSSAVSRALLAVTTLVAADLDDDIAVCNSLDKFNLHDKLDRALDDAADAAVAARDE
jgi:acetyl-CoA carboxylase/biotin carboxylase 1